MKYKVFAIFDSKVKAFITPFFQRSSGEAIRAFSDAVGDVNSGFCKHPEDYTLFELGEFEDMDASFQLLETPHSLGLATQFVKEVK